jgi:hypothetical protein
VLNLLNGKDMLKIMKNKTINKNVGLWLSLDKDNKFITIDKAVNGVSYYCPECKSEVRARALNSDYMSAHFYHLNLNNCDCKEAIKQYWKEYLIGIGEIIELPKQPETTIIDKRIDFELHKNDITIKVDLMLKTIENKFIIITFNNDIEYIDKLKTFEYPIYYIDINKLKCNKSIDTKSLYQLLYIKIDIDIKTFEYELNTIRYNMRDLYKNREYDKANKFVYRLGKLLEDIESIKLQWLYNYSKDLFADKWNGYVYHKVVKLLNELCKKMIEYKKNS